MAFEIVEFDESVIEGTGVAEVLTAQGGAGGGYFASERIEATLEGRQGAFVIQHWGLADRADQSSKGSTLPNSGTGELTGITGHAMEREFVSEGDTVQLLRSWTGHEIYRAEFGPVD